jgi:arylsulfatase A-like enzyme
MTVALSVALPACSPRRESPTRHVVLISLDTTRADHIGTYGSSVKTPHIDAFASEGVVFENASVASTMTLPSHVSLLTGVWPRSHGVARNGFTVNEANLMLPEMLVALGFRSAGFSAAVALSDLLNFPQGFDVWDQDPETYSGHVVANRNARRAEEITDAAVAYLDGVSDARLLLFVHYVDPHIPYDPPEPYRSMYGLVPREVSGSFESVQRARIAHQEMALPRFAPLRKAMESRLTWELIFHSPRGPVGVDEHLARLYAGEVSYMDHHVGRLLEELKRRGLYEDALIIITSDHGETFWEHGDVWNHGLAVYETTVRVPLIVRFPDATHAGTRIDALVSNVDVVPTILDYLGIEAPAAIDGRSLLPLLAGRGLEGRVTFSEGSRVAGAPEWAARRWLNERKPHSIRSGRWKYVLTPYLGVEELYDLESDPGEQNDLLREPSEEARRRARALRSELERWMAAADPLPSEFFPRVKASEEPDAKARRAMWERLKALGYVSEEDEEP